MRVNRLYLNCLSSFLFFFILFILLFLIFFHDYPRPSTISIPYRTSIKILQIQSSLPDLNPDHPHPSFHAGPQPRPSGPNPSLPDLKHDHPHPVFPAGPQPQPSTPNIPRRTSSATIHAQLSLPDLNQDRPRQIEYQNIYQIIYQIEY